MKKAVLFTAVAAALAGLAAEREFNVRDCGARPDAVVCESDYVAAVFRNTLGKLGLSVPGDVMLAGFDDVRCAMTAAPPLTTVHQPCEDIATLAYRTLRERIADATLPPRRIHIPAPLVIRASTSVPKPMRRAKA